MARRRQHCSCHRGNSDRSRVSIINWSTRRRTRRYLSFRICRKWDISISSQVFQRCFYWAAFNSRRHSWIYVAGANNRSFSVWAGAFALSIIMIPIVVRVTEETLKVVPNSIREAGYSLGIPKRKITLFKVLKSTKSGVLTGIILAISRTAGETAPLIMTMLGTSFFTSLTGPVDALPLRIWRIASQPYEYAHAFGCGLPLF